MKDQKFKIRSKQLRNGARDQSCVRCGINDGTIVTDDIKRGDE